MDHLYLSKKTMNISIVRDDPGNKVDKSLHTVHKYRFHT